LRTCRNCTRRLGRVNCSVTPQFKHSAIQILLGDRVPHSENAAGIDDDTPAIKLWYAGQYERKLLVDIFQKALRRTKQTRGQEVDEAKGAVVIGDDVDDLPFQH